MAMRKFLFGNRDEEIQIFLCVADDVIYKRICSALKIASGIMKTNVIQIKKIDTLMSHDASKKDILIADKAIAPTFAVAQVMTLMDEAPKIIWISSAEKIQLTDLINEIQSAA